MRLPVSVLRGLGVASAGVVVGLASLGCQGAAEKTYAPNQSTEKAASVRLKDGANDVRRASATVLREAEESDRSSVSPEPQADNRPIPNNAWFLSSPGGSQPVSATQNFNGAEQPRVFATPPPPVSQPVVAPPIRKPGWRNNNIRAACGRG